MAPSEQLCANPATLLQEHVKREKQIMAECDCPFMVNLVTSFKDGAHLYMLMECVMGGELFTYLQSRPSPLKEDHARFYAASVILGLEYMQERSIMWRCVPPRPSHRLRAVCALHLSRTCFSHRADHLMRPAIGRVTGGMQTPHAAASLVAALAPVHMQAHSML